MAGTPAWCALGDTDPRKVAALFDAAQHWALRVETCQIASIRGLCDSCPAVSRDISAAEDWVAIAQYIKDHREFYAARPWLKRKPA
jgi:hypothetical protein